MRRILNVFIVVALTWWAPQAVAAPAAQLIFAGGKVTALDARGNSRALTQGSDVNSGDTVVTGSGAHAQLRFADGGMVSLQADSRMRIDDYRFGGAAAEDRGFFSLVKGGLRAISGSIGKHDPAAYRLDTPVATVGIRGTHFTLRLCAADCNDVGVPVADGLYASVVEGKIELSNAVGAYLLDQGQSAFVANTNLAPVPTVLPPAFRHGATPAGVRPATTAPAPASAPVPPATAETGRLAPPASAPVQSVPNDAGGLTPSVPVMPMPDAPVSPAPSIPVGPVPSIPVGPIGVPDSSINIYDQTGLPVHFFDGGAQAATNALRVYGVGATAADGAGHGFFRAFSINDRGELMSYGLNPETFLGSNSVRDSGYSGLIGWGRWTGGETALDPPATGSTFAAPASLHYVMTGAPTLAAFFASGATLTYNFFAGTPATSVDGTDGMGIMSGTLTLTTGATPTVAANFNVDHAGNLYSVLATALPVNADAAAFSGSATAVGPTTTCVNGCASSINGIFAGALAQEAGIVYQIGEATPIHGAGVFR